MRDEDERDSGDRLTDLLLSVAEKAVGRSPPHGWERILIWVLIVALVVTALDGGPPLGI